MVSPIVFEELPGLLRGAELRNWLRTDGARIFTAFDTTSEALTYVREYGIKIRTQDFYDIARQVSSLWESSEKLEDYAGSQTIPLSWHDSEHGLDLSTKFQYRVQLIGADQNTGILKSQWMTVASETRLSQDQVKDVARSYVGEGGVSGEIEDYFIGTIQPLRR